MEISQEGIALIKRFEGCKLQAYKCSAGVPTIGYGSTRGVTMDMEISQDRAEALLLEDIADFEEEVNKCVKVPLEQNQFLEPKRAPTLKSGEPKTFQKFKKNAFKNPLVFGIRFLIDFYGFLMDFGIQSRRFFDRFFDLKQKRRFCKNMRFA